MHGRYFTPRDSAAMIASVERDIAALPGTRSEAYVPPFQPINWSADRPDLTPEDADALARQIVELRNLPEVHQP